MWIKVLLFLLKFAVFAEFQYILDLPLYIQDRDIAFVYIQTMIGIIIPVFLDAVIQ